MVGKKKANNKIPGAFVAFGVTAILVYQIIRLWGWGDLPFGLSIAELTSSTQITILLAIMGLVTATVFAFGVFSLIANKLIASLVTIIGVIVLGVFSFIQALSALTF